MKFALKIGYHFFCKVMVCYKNENKGVIDDFFLNNDNSKNISRNFSGAVVGRVGSVQYQIIPCSGRTFLKIYSFPSNAQFQH